MFRWSPEATAEQIDAVASALRALPAKIPEIRTFKCGPDIGKNAGNWDFAVVAEFDTLDDQIVYRDHPDHVRVINEELAAIRIERAAVQYDTEAV